MTTTIPVTIPVQITPQNINVSQMPSQALNPLSSQWQFNPIDFKQMQLLAQLPPGHRICTMLEAQALARGLIMGRLSRLYPQATPQELGLKLLAEVSRDRHIPTFR